MTVPTNMQDLSTTESANSPSGSENPVSTDNHLRAIGAIVRRTNAKGADIASSGTTDIGAATGEFIDVTGTTTITSLGTIAAGITRTVRFTGALTLTHNASSLILPSSANITTANGDTAIFRSLGSGNWKCISYTKQDGSALVIAGADSSKLDVSAKASQVEAEAGTDNDNYMTALRVKQAIDENAATDYAIGVSQTWQDLSGLRAHSTSYENTTSKPIMVSLTYSSANYAQVSTDESTWVNIGRTSGAAVGSFSFIVPIGHFYRVNGSTTITDWAELR